MSAAELARTAAQVMSERGHCKGRVEDDQGRVCYVGALVKAGGLLGRQDGDCQYAEDWDLVLEASWQLLKARGEKSAYPVNYNNRADVTGEDVILLLKQTAERLDDLQR